MRIYIIILLFLSLTIYAHSSNLQDWKRPDNVPIALNNPQTKEKIALGKLLFFDKRLSSTNKVSCASCHNPKYCWCDKKRIALGVKNRLGRRNTPTLLNCAYLQNFFHDARADSLEEQAKGSIESKFEMDMPLKKLVVKLKKIDGYKQLFEKSFGTNDITAERILKAIASFERTLINDITPFHRWIRGDKHAISDKAKEGFKIFKKKGRCDSCHSGFNFTNESLNNIGLGDEKDLGVYEITKNKSRIWYGAFKTPTLIGVELTAPYFHNGSIETLTQAVTICGNGGKKPVKIRSPFFRDRRLDKNDVELVVEFLKTLTPSPLKIKIPTKFPK